MNLRSMTGFSQAQASLGDSTIIVEISSLNHKGRDLRLGLAPELQSLEVLATRKITAKISRGAISLQMRIQTSPGHHPQSRLRINHQLVQDLTREMSSVATEFGLENRLAIRDLLAIPGVVEIVQNELPIDELREIAGQTLDLAIERLLREREREGCALAEELGQRARKMLEQGKRINELSDSAMCKYRQRLIQRIATLQVELPEDDERLVKELAFAAQKTDVTEELVRLRSHLLHFLQLINHEEPPIGRKLQFLVQEIHREINTLSAKTSETEIAEQALEIKSELEKIREQCSNVE